MESNPSAADALPPAPLKTHEQIEYRVNGRILHTTARGPFTKLVEKIPPSINEFVQRLSQQGRWGQIVTFQQSAFMPAAEMQNFRSYLKQRYEDPEIRPVIALVFATDPETAPLLVQEFLDCYIEAGIKTQAFDDHASARDWVESEISHFPTRIDWKDSYKVGDQSIDEQHRELFKRAAYVLAATSHQGQVLSAMRLFQYMRTHLSHEEEMMRRLDYPKRQAHTREHQEIIARLNIVSLKIANDNLIKSDLEELLGDWFLAHMETADTELARFAKALK